MAAIAEGESPFTYSVHVYTPEWLRGRRESEDALATILGLDPAAMPSPA